jgi:hypothetical protein
MYGVGCRVKDSGCRIEIIGLRVQGSRGTGVKFRVQGSEFRV